MELILLGSMLNFFLISKNDIHTKGCSLHEKHRANQHLQEKGKREKKQKKTEQQTNYKRVES